MISEHVRILVVIVPKLAFREEQRQILLTDVIEVPIAPCVSNAQKRFDIVPYGTILSTHCTIVSTDNHSRESVAQEFVTASRLTFKSRSP